MKTTNLFKVTAIAASLILVSACSTSNTSRNNHGQYGNGSGGDKVMGTDLGNGMSGSGRGSRLSAGENQSYYFDFDKSELHSDDVASVDAQANYLVRNKQSHVLVAGNTDARGSREYNIALGERRAKTVEERMKMQGVSDKQMRSISYGAERPVATGSDESDFEKNRRADLTYNGR